MKTREERLEAMKARKERMLLRQQGLKAKRELKKAVKKLGPLAVFDPSEDAEPVAIDALDDMNAAVQKLGEEKKVERTAEELARIEDWRQGRQRVDMIRARQSDANHYFVMCFQTQGQCDAFLNGLRARGIIPSDQDMFVDGRLVAPHVAGGLKLPDPEYPMEYTPQKAMGPAARMEKIPRGYT